MAFAAYPSSVVYKLPGQKLKKNAVQHLLWGDWLKPLGPVQGEGELKGRSSVSRIQ